MINPTVILQQRIQKASDLAVIALRCTIHTSRANRFKKIDLRKLKAYPEKKERIKKIIHQNQFKVWLLLNNWMMISSQPIKTKSFPIGGEIIANIKDKNHES